MEIAAFDDDVYENMSYDERRNFNLARNREMMALLFAGSGSGPGGDLGVRNEGGEGVKGGMEEGGGKPVDVEENEAGAEELQEGIVQEMFCREKEVLRLLQYLDRGLFPSQPMLVYGPVATGKSLLCKAALSRITSTAQMSISCKSVASSKRFIQGLWLDALASISKFNKSQLNISSSFEEDTKIKNVSTFSDLVDRMASLMFCQAHILKQVNTSKIPGLIIHIDHIDKADWIEEGLTRRLLCLDELCHPMIKVLAVSRSLPRSMTATCLLLQMPAYTDAQLVSILCKKHQLESETNSIHSSSNSTDQLANSSSRQSEFRALCEQALPQFTITTRRVDEIWTMMQELFAHRASVSKNNKATVSNPDSSSVSTNEGLSKSAPVSSKRPLDEDIKNLVELPAVHMTQNATPIDMESFYGKNWCNHLPLKTKALAIAAFLASRNPASTDRTTFGQATKGRRKKTKVDPSEAGVGSKSSSQPQSFGVERLLGIFKQIMPSISASTSNMPCNKYRKVRSVSSAGEVDKKVSIFSVDLRRQKHFNTKNEALLYTTINTLVKKRVLIVYSVSAAGTKAVKMSDSNNHLLYLCSLPMNRAEELAQSIGFPLRDYLSY